MKKLVGETIQKPLVVAGLLFVMIVTLTIAIYSYPGGNDASQPLMVKTQQNYPSTTGSVRNGQQIASIRIIDPNEVSPDESTNAGTEDASSYATGLMDNPEIVEALKPPNLVTESGDKVKFKIDRFQKLAVQPLKFQVYDLTGKELTPDYLSSIQGQKIHFYLVHANLNEFLHIVPEFNNGVWNVSALMPTPGTYYAYLFLDPIKGDPIIYKSDLIVRNESPSDIKKSDPTSELTAKQGNTSAGLELKRFEDYRGFILNVKNGESGAVIAPNMESVGRLTLLSHDSAKFFKTLTADAVSDEAIGNLSFSTGHLSAGRYTAFAEIKIGGTVYVFPITFDIGG